MEMPERGEEYREIQGQRVRIAWRKANYGEWLAWCYLPGPDGLHNQGIGFDARGPSPEAAVETVVRRIEERLTG
jgi:hypothetical protein